MDATYRDQTFYGIATGMINCLDLDSAFTAALMGKEIHSGQKDIQAYSLQI